MTHTRCISRLFIEKKNNSKKKENLTIFVTFSFDYIDVKNQNSIYQIREIVDNVDFKTNIIFDKFD